LFFDWNRSLKKNTLSLRVCFELKEKMTSNNDENKLDDSNEEKRFYFKLKKRDERQRGITSLSKTKCYLFKCVYEYSSLI
jgi:hypothetical protein